jgi:diguanylate cyclase (GGDEF)-like protein
VGVVIIDTGDGEGNDIRLLRAKQSVTGGSLHIIALIPDAAKSEASRLLQEGADDYLLYGFTEAALHLRVLNAQHRFSLQAADRAARELAADPGWESASDDRQLPSEASRDPLTDLLDRRHALDRISREWSIAIRDAAPIACMVLAIDHFKQVNEQHGHAVGNTVLRQIAAIVAHCCRSSDIVFRHGEDEFCIVCPGIPEPKARLLADRIAAAVRTHEFVLPSGTLRVTSRIGVAIRSPEITSPEAMIEAAVKALNKG